MLVAVIILTFPVTVFAQDRVQGFVVDREGEPIPNAFITLYELPDSTFVDNTATNQEGMFFFTIDKKHKREKLFVELSCIGYIKRYVKADSLNRAVILDDNVVSLEEVTIVAARPIFKRKGGKFIYSPSMADKSFNDCYSLLKITPMLKVESNSVSVIGRGESTIYINGRKTAMSKDMIMDYLRSLPPDRLERIEINPRSGVTHSATMRNGIVNIILKRQDDGFKGSVGAEIDYVAERISPRLSTNINYAKDKLQMGLSIALYQGNQLAKQRTEYFFKNEQRSSRSEYTNDSKFNSLNSILNFSYDLTTNSLIGASASLGLRQSKDETIWNNLYFNNAANNSLTTTRETRRTPLQRPVYSTKVFYNLKTDNLGSNLEVSTSFSSFKKATNMQGNRRNATMLNLYKQNIATDNYGLNGQVKYKYLLNKNNRVEAGYEINHSYLSNNYAYLKGVGGGKYILETDVSNHFVYNEMINAGFIKYSRQWSEVFNTIVGLRLEHTDIEGNQKTTGERYRNSYTNLFPQIGLEFDLADGIHNIALDYGKSLTRPFFNYLNPFKVWQSELSYTKGNIYLRPSISSSFEFTYTLKGNYVFGVLYNHDTDTYGSYSLPLENNVIENGISNYGYDNSFSCYASVNRTFFKGFWRLAASAEYNYSESKGKIETVDVGYSESRWGLQLRNVITLSAKRRIVGRLNYSYSSPSRGLTKIGYAKHLLSLSLAKTFLNGSSFNIYLSNILNYKPDGYFDNSLYHYMQDNLLNQTMIQVQYTYSFGNKKLRKLKDHSTDSNLSRFKNY
ncbi:Uncharacterised protein [Porphyromonas macacae]|uniref:Outer membrane protein beta-barrel domain-containing protein n=2 Tax=Porphyromonas macacae TaxID=28115 RepID=A0A379E755_9PORP|nr:outer membrane beta-barrel family protein [Porphyromonas macacae]SUB88496.1 Uncharacterised protein [Porphyromonas macacae]